MNEQQEELTDAIIDFQVKHHVNDTDLAFASHLSVEKVHAMKLVKVHSLLKKLTKFMTTCLPTLN